MNDNNFDKRIKKLVDSCNEPLGEDLWGGIQQRMFRKRRITIFKRVGYVAAVAACLVMGVFLVTPDDVHNDGAVACCEVKIVSAAPQIDAPEVVDFSQLRKGMRVAVVESVVTESNPAESVPAEAIPAESVPARKKAKSESKPLSIYDQLPQTDYFASLDAEKKQKKHKATLGLTANIIAANPASSDFSVPQYAPGVGSISNYGIVPISEPRFYFPLSFGLQLQIPIMKRFAIGTGVNYTVLHSEYQALIDNSAQGMVDQNLHYIGVPLSLYFNIIQNDVLKFYVDGGGTIEKGVHSKCSIKDLFDEVSYRNEKISGVQWSANLGLGFEYQFIGFLGLYLDPSITYFFDSGQPFSVRTSQPLQFKLELGLRFHL